MLPEIQELENRILAEFDDKNSENVFSVLNAIIDPKGQREEVDLFCETIIRLLESDCIFIAVGRSECRVDEVLNKARSLAFAATLPEWFIFYAKDPHWTLAKGEFGKDVIPVIELTEIGEEKSIEIRELRGFRWWSR